MRRQTVFMFPGQGSQYFHMGKELYENQARFRFWMDECDAILRPLIRVSLTDILYRSHGKGEPFDRLLHSNPALLSIEYSLARLLMESGIRPDAVLGYSLGEFAAAVVSEVLSLEAGLRMVVGMAELVETRTPQARMVAIFESPAIMSEFPALFRGCRLTGLNFDRNFVVTSLPEDALRLQEGLKQRNIVFQPLPVKYGFHTEWIDPVEQEFKRMAAGLPASPAGIPIISCQQGGTIRETTPGRFWDVIRRPVHFERTVRSTLEGGACAFIDAGPSGTLATFLKYLMPRDSDSAALQAMNQFGRDSEALERLQAGLSASADAPGRFSGTPIQGKGV